MFSNTSFQSTKQYLQPVMKSACRDSIKHSTEAVILMTALGALGLAGAGVRLGYRKTKSSISAYMARRLTAPAAVSSPSPYGEAPAAASAPAAAAPAP